jgi:hypothetical protein
MKLLDAIETLEHWYLLERFSDKLSCGPIIFKILGEFYHFVISSKYLQLRNCKICAKINLWFISLGNPAICGKKLI